MRTSIFCVRIQARRVGNAKVQTWAGFFGHDTPERRVAAMRDLANGQVSWRSEGGPERSKIEPHGCLDSNIARPRGLQPCRQIRRPRAYGRVDMCVMGGGGERGVSRTTMR